MNHGCIKRTIYWADPHLLFEDISFADKKLYLAVTLLCVKLINVRKSKFYIGQSPKIFSSDIKTKLEVGGEEREDRLGILTGRKHM